MKICFWGKIAKGFKGEPIGGGEKQLFLISSELAKRGNDIYIIDFEISEDITIDNVSIVSLKKFAKESNSNKYVALYKLLKSLDPDIYYSRIRSSIHLIGLFAAKKNKKKFVYHSAHDLDAATFKQRLKGFYLLTPNIKKIILHIIHSEFLFPYLLRRTNLIIAQNKEQMINYKKKYPKVKVEIVNNIFDFRENQLSGNDKKTQDFIVVGSLDLRKGVKNLSRIINALPKKRFLILGKARDKNGVRFIKKIQELDNVTYHGNVNQEKVIEFISNSRFLITTSTGEGFPNVFLEAWSTGTPVLSLNINPSNVVNEFQLGKFYDGNMDVMIDDLDKILTSDFNSSKMIDYIHNHHSISLVLEEMENTLKTLG